MNIIGANITHIRQTKDIKQKDLLARIQSKGIDITGSCLSKIEGQTRTVTDKELVIIANALEVNVTDLLSQS